MILISAKIKTMIDRNGSSHKYMRAMYRSGSRHFGHSIMLHRASKEELLMASQVRKHVRKREGGG